MLFNSYAFWVFLLTVILFCRWSSHRVQNTILLIASYIFYGVWDWRFLPLIASMTLVNFLLGIKIAEAGEDKKRAKKFLTLSVIFSLGVLGFFKYWEFFTDSTIAFVELLGFQPSIPLIEVLLPVGISFYTFQTMSYSIDVYRGDVKPTRNLADFALYVAYFPQLVAGPIERSSSLLPQITDKRTPSKGDFAEGLCLVMYGLFLKVVLADNLAYIANGAFSGDANVTGADALIGIYAFAFQIYGDFAGYSSIARGVSKWLGIHLMTNFRMPYLAKNPSDFWQRWHISLSSWLRDYLYIPLGGNRCSAWKVYRNLMLTMLLGGLWHGAGWTFIFWGAIHGLVLCVYRKLGANTSLGNQLSRAFASLTTLAIATLLIYKIWMGPTTISKVPWLITAGILAFTLSRDIGAFIRSLKWNSILSRMFFFQIICFTWLFFRAENIEQVWDMLGRIFMDFRITEFTQYAFWMILFFAGPLMLYEIWLDRDHTLRRLEVVSWGWRAAAYCYITFFLLEFPPSQHGEFIYFQF